MAVMIYSHVQPENVPTHRHTRTWLHSQTQSAGCGQTGSVFRLSNCANKLKGQQPASLGSLAGINNLLIIKDKRKIPQTVRVDMRVKNLAVNLQKAHRNTFLCIVHFDYNPYILHLASGT